MDLSVIIPMYNHEEYVEQAIKSMIKGVTYNVEIIVVNDASTDKSLEKVKKLQKEFGNIKILQNEKNCGCAYSINRGLEIAQGKYIGINSSDDFVDEGYYQKMLEIAFKENADVVCANIANYDTETNVTTYCKIEEGNIVAKDIQYNNNPLQVDATILLGHWTASSASTKIIKKEYYDKYKFIGSKANDIPCIYPILAVANKIIYYPNLYKYYRIMKKSLSRKDDEESYNSVIDSIIKAFRLLDEIDAREEKEILFFNNCMSYLFNGLLNIENEDVRKKCIENFYRTLIDYNSKIFEEMSESIYCKRFLKIHNVNIMLYKYLKQGEINEFLWITNILKENERLQLKIINMHQIKNIETEEKKRFISKEQYTLSTKRSNTIRK